MKTVLQVLTQARGLIKKGWCKGSYQEIRGGKTRYCIIGSVIAADKEKDCVEKVFSILLKVVGAQGLSAWNDSKRRTKTQVIHAFDKAIKLAKHANLKPTESQEG